MRYVIILGLTFALAAVPAVQAQQVAAPLSTTHPTLLPVEVQSAPSEMELAPAISETVRVEDRTVDDAAAQQVSGRNILTIIGAVVVVLALVSFLR